MTQKTTIDWLRYRTQAEVLAGLDALRGLFGPLGQKLALHHQERGKDGFKSGAAICLADMAVGRVDFGGESQRGWVRWNLTGKGCEWVQDWDALDALEALPAAELRRTDIALTTWHGEVSHEAVVDAYQAGGFNCGGRPPNLRQIVNSNPKAGRTCYVGQRDADKYLRAYEKGRELVQAFPETVEITHVDGCPVEGIYRTELELKAQTRPIGWEVIERRDQYFAGSYPFCGELLPEVECDILMRRPERALQTDLAVSLENCRVQYGAALFTALVAHHGDITAVWDKIVGKDHCMSLVRAGVLLVEHA